MQWDKRLKISMRDRVAADAIVAALNAFERRIETQDQRIRELEKAARSAQRKRWTA